ncbi:MULTISPECIES: helix-turn-helix domain-containing protein [Lentzea]|jgi:transcriptional regulator with XRE-family HTH domain|uniref:Helix-turn-helix domain-containing protein n=2 Tax=Lentzea TaxID=165301 RepID=A0A1H9XXP1_9PSEU|nr:MULTISPECIES: helix-turn-helix transcriptional regulator [Lentzea]MCR3748473.1 Helix-turn-helix domain-containing protein [Lentzea californiensis]RDI27902.1 helix-turn-helix protein [Lentzea flaviverrucosa]GHH51618.1 transcriptional regulator [Lentzea cavernae]SES50942.1 Helix-turn-helix domain-containing protein [Lentzea flaviverrucosa]
MTVLLREAIGDRLRHARTNQRRTLREVSRTARVSLGYLSEVERGRKEASSELLAAICDALELPLSELLHHVASDIGAVQQTPDTVPDTVPDGRSERGKLEGGRVLPSTLSDDLSDLRLQPMLTHRLTSKIGETPKAVVAA